MVLASFLKNETQETKSKVKGEKKMTRVNGIIRSRLNSISSGELLRLKDGLYRQLKEREWIFNRTENNLVFLMNKERAYGVVVRNEDIDWSQ